MLPALNLSLSPLNHLLLSHWLVEKENELEEGENRNSKIEMGLSLADFWRVFPGTDVPVPAPVSVSSSVKGFSPSSALLTPDSASQGLWQPGSAASANIWPTDWRSYKISRGIKTGHGNIAELFHIISANGVNRKAFTLECYLVFKIY